MTLETNELGLVLPVNSEYGFLKEKFRPRRNGREFEWRDTATGRYFVIKVVNLNDLSIASVSLRDFRDKAIFDLPYASKNGKKPGELPLWVSAVDDQDQFAHDVPNEVLSYMKLLYDTQGERQRPNDFSYGWGNKYELKARGHYDYSTLPNWINFHSTVEAFKDQLRYGDFSTPELLE